MPRPKPLAAPRIDRFELLDVADAPPSALRSHSVHEAVAFASPDDPHVLEGSDLSGIELSECVLSGLDLSDVRIIDSRLRETRLDGVTASVMAAQGGDWRDVEVLGSRIGAAELYESTWHSVRLHGCKLGFVNLRASELVDVVFEDCTIDELDLGDAKATRLAFPGCRIGVLEASHVRFADVDLRGADLEQVRGVASLRGAAVSFDQLLGLAPALADELGIRVV
ncbi:pentapeptide repeat-containing protein [Planctomonas sp. JC2975]|uniref:pentapeptide repeat-containing protein n=1 Tax=Planctomonas sp. JC2975 TaxID=2729626 RepID=UPI00147677E5|nr:pentapeptide repeat-containing protein [Planctomonas sp. JC2975]NNC12926.1 pentapeptide repeat-containing protein [Planctomonas sp. JC2975]